MNELPIEDLAARQGLKNLQAKIQGQIDDVKLLQHVVEVLPGQLTETLVREIVDKIQGKQIPMGKMESDKTEAIDKAYASFLMDIRKENLEKTGGCGRKDPKTGKYIACAKLNDLIWFAEDLLDKYKLTISFMPYYMDKQHLLKSIILHEPTGQKLCGLSPVYVDYDLAKDYGSGRAWATEESKGYTNAKKHAYAAILGVHIGGD